MANPLLDPVLPAELADRSQVIEYKGVINEFWRLREISEQELGTLAEAERPRGWREAPVEVSIRFGWLDTKRGMPAATGQVRATLTVVCQRCLEAFELAIDAPLRIVFGDEASNLAPGTDFDTWDADGDRIRLLDVIEETIVMALPLAPTHGAEADCGELAGRIPAGTVETIKPFANLRAQMDELNK